MQEGFQHTPDVLHRRRTGSLFAQGDTVVGGVHHPRCVAADGEEGHAGEVLQFRQRDAGVLRADAVDDQVRDSGHLVVRQRRSQQEQGVNGRDALLGNEDQVSALPSTAK